MGLFRILLNRGAKERIPAVMASLELPVIRVEPKENGLHYFYESPRLQRDSCFWIYDDGPEAYWMSGLSPLARMVAEGFTVAGLFADKPAD